jgi:hypothetical protein
MRLSSRHPCPWCPRNGASATLILANRGVFGACPPRAREKQHYSETGPGSLSPHDHGLSLAAANKARGCAVWAQETASRQRATMRFEALAARVRRKGGGSSLILLDIVGHEVCAYPHNYGKCCNCRYSSLSTYSTHLISVFAQSLNTFIAGCSPETVSRDGSDSRRSGWCARGH